MIRQKRKRSPFTFLCLRAVPAAAVVIHVTSGCWTPTSPVTEQAPSLHRATAVVLVAVVGTLAPSDVQGSGVLV